MPFGFLKRRKDETPAGPDAAAGDGGRARTPGHASGAVDARSRG